MPNPSMLPSLLREMVCARTLPREPEPDLVMEGEDQVASYALAGRHPSGMSAVGLFHAGQATKVLNGRRSAIDLGCGPCTQLARIAELNPSVNFTGVDLSESMLESGQSYLRECQLSNVTLVRDNITSLEKFSDQSTDAVISTVALHHLPSFADLQACFAQIRRILRPHGALYIADLTRPKSLKSVVSLAYMDRGHQPHLFLLDYERSLRAAFLFDELKTLATERLPAELNAQVFATFLVPLFTVIKTPDRELHEEQRQRLRKMRDELPKRYRGDLDDLRLFFRLGGLKNDPFR